MFIRIDIEKTFHERTSKLGHKHVYERKKAVVVLRCDNCGEVFNRPKGSMDPNRLNNNFFHCCPNCDPKRFAQKKGAERKIIWDKTVSSLDDISKL
jgi:Zn finger protein HypA/HybF involved in hydrogenase expression